MFAFTDAELGGLDAAAWIGIDNFLLILIDPVW